MESDVADNASVGASPTEIANSTRNTLQLLSTLVVLGAIILATVVGNAFVIAAVILERNLRTHFANYLVASLAMADMMVAVLVMPIAAVKDVTNRWIFGYVVCDAWISIDVICCTASILHLVAISVDRYWAVTRLDYIHNRSKQSILVMIAISWTISIVVSLPPLFLKNNSEEPRVLGQHDCIISQNLGYTVFSTVSAFYLPFVAMMIIYLKVYQAARNRIRRKQFKPVHNRTSPVGPPQAAATVLVQVIRPDEAVLKVGVRCRDNVTSREPAARCVGARRAVGSRERECDCHVTSAVDRNELDNENVPYEGEAAIDSIDISRDLSKVTSSGGKIQRGSNDDDDGCMPTNRGKCRSSSLTVDVKQSGSNSAKFVDLLSIADDFLDGSHHGNDHRQEMMSDRGMLCPGVTLTCGRHIGSRVSIEKLSPTRNSSSSPSFDVVNGRRHSMNDVISSPKSAETQQPFDSQENILDPRTASRRSRSFLDITRQLMTVSSSSRAKDGPDQCLLSHARSREQTEVRRERKAARTLAIITGTFILCWLPFFILAILRPFCGASCHYPAVLVSVIGWLGYVNSLLNPVIYTVFNPDFRSAFSRILFGKYNSKLRQRWMFGK